MRNGAKFKRLTQIYTPTDMRPALGTMAYGVNWLLPPDPKIEKVVREAVEAITCDLWAIGPQDHEMIPSYLSSIEQPLEELRKVGFALSYAVVDDAPAIGNQVIPGWTTTIYVVSEQPLVFASVEDSVTSPLHLLNACPATEKNIIQTIGEGVGVLPKRGFQLGWLDQEDSWCSECWKTVDRNRNELKAVYAPSTHEDDPLEQHIKELLNMQAILAQIIGMKEDEFASYVSESSLGDEAKAEVLSTYASLAGIASPTDDVRRLLALPAETDSLEFKETLNWDVRKAQFNDERLMDVQKAICAMLNRAGGTILIGVRDEGNQVVGIAKDMEKFKTHDAFQRKIAESFGIKLKPDPSELVRVRFIDIDNETLARVDVQPDRSHAYSLNDKVYVRRDGESREFAGPNLLAWWTRRQRGEE